MRLAFQGGSRDGVALHTPGNPPPSFTFQGQALASDAIAPAELYTLTRIALGIAWYTFEREIWDSDQISGT